MQVVGDDLLVSHPKRVALAAENKSCNALLLKVPISITSHTPAFYLLSVVERR